MRLGLRILTLLLVLVLLVGTLAGCAATTKPLNYFKEALENTVRERFGGELLSTLTEVLDGGTVELEFGGIHHLLLDTPLEEAELRLWLNKSELSVAAEGSMTVKGTDYDGQLFFDRDLLVASSDTFFGSTDLAIDFSTLSGDLKNSIFRNNSGTEYMIPWLGESAADDILSLKNSFFTVFGSLEEWYLILDEMAELFLECLADHLIGDWYTEDGRLYVAVAVNNEVLSRALRDLYEQVVADHDFCQFLRKLAETADAIASAEAGNGTKITKHTVSVDNFLKNNVVINQWCATIDNDLAPFYLSLDAAIHSGGDLIETANLALSVRDAEMFALGLDLSDDDTNVISLRHGGALRTLTYTVTEDSLRHYHADMTYQKSDAATGVAAFAVAGALRADRQTDIYTLTLTQGATARCFTGTFDKKIDGYTFSVDTLTMDGNVYNFAFALRIDVDGEPTELPQDYKKLFNLSHAEYRPIHRRAIAALEKLKEDWGEAPYSPVAFLNSLLGIAGIAEEIG